MIGNSTARVMGWVIFLSINLNAVIVYSHLVERNIGGYEHLFAIPVLRICYWLTAVALAGLLSNLPLSHFGYRMTVLGILLVVATGGISEFHASMTTRQTMLALLATSLPSQIISAVLALAEGHHRGKHK